MLLSMKQNIPSVRDVEVGTDFVGAASSFDLMELVVCDDIKAFNAFCVDPYHDKIRAYMKDRVAAGWKVDFDDGRTPESEVPRAR